MELVIRDGSKLRIATDSIYQYPPMRKILNTFGDNSKVLEQVINYIYFTSDPRALPRDKGYNAKEAHAYAIKQTKLSDKFVVTEDIKRAQKFYYNAKVSAPQEYINNVIASLRLANKLCDVIINRQDINDIELTDEQITSTATSIKEVLSLASKINESIPKLADSIKLLKQMDIDDEEDKTNTMRGGGDISDSHYGIGEIEEDD